MRTLISILLTTLFCGAAYGANSTTGALRGLVTDSSGGVLLGATLTITGPSLPGTRSTTTDAAGEYRFPFLPPGRGYTLKVATAGFETAAHEDVQVSLGREGTVNATLRPLTTAEVVVVAAAPLIDVRDTTSSTNITAEQFEAFPTRRDFQQLTILAPGVTFERDPLSPTVGGATHLENDYIIEGLSTRDPRTAASATNLTMNFVKEVQVMTGEFSAEYGRAMGGVINVLTKSGGNELQGDLSTFYEDQDWSSEQVRYSNRGTTRSDLGHDKKDFALSLGGPIIRDRAWFFLAYGPRRDDTPIHLVDTELAIDRREQVLIKEDVYAGKISASLSPSHHMTLSGFGNPKTQSGWLIGARADPGAALRTQGGGSRNLTLRYDGAYGPRVTLEASVGSHLQSSYVRADTEQGRSAPFQFDFPTRFGHGGYASIGEESSSRDALALRSSMFLNRHEVRIGGDFEQNRHESTYIFTSYTFLGQRNINPSLGIKDELREFMEDNSGHGTNDTVSLFAQDRWQIAPNLHLNVGLRWEQQVLSSGQGAVIATGRNVDGTLQRRREEDFTIDDNWAPRLGISWDPFGNGRSKIYASAGRFFESIPVNINLSALNGYFYTEHYYYSSIRHTSENWFNPSGSPVNDDWTRYHTFQSRFTSGFDKGTAIDPQLELQYQDELSLGGEVQFGRASAAGVRLVSRIVKDVIEDHHVVDSRGIHVDYIVANVGRSEWAPGFREPRRLYQAVELFYQRRLTNRWQVSSSFVASRARGDYDGLYQYANPFEAPNTTFDLEYPRWQQNAYGRLRGDRPYQFKLYSSYEFPFGLTLSEGLFYTAGVPVSAFAAAFVSEGVRAVYLLPRGSAGRTPAFYSLDLHAAWRLPLRMGSDLAVSLIADVFNATDNHAATEVDELYFYRGMPGWEKWVAPENLDELGYPKFNPDLPKSPYFNTPTTYQAPRAIQLGVKVTY